MNLSYLEKYFLTGKLRTPCLLEDERQKGEIKRRKEKNTERRSVTTEGF